MTKKKIILICVVAIVLGLSAWAIVHFRRAGRPQIANTIQPFYTDISRSFRATGQVSPRNRLEIRPPFAGRVEEILVQEGEYVRRGQIIIWMSSNERAAMIDAAMARGPEEHRRWLGIYRPTPIMAPMDGFIILRNNEPGQTVTSADAIVVMADDLIIEADIDETDLRHIYIGKRVEMTLDAYPDKWFWGTVEHIAFESRLISNVTVYRVRIKPDSRPDIFRAGMTATIIVMLETRQNILALPSSFITQGRGGRGTVNLKTARGTQEREIRTGISDGRNVEVLSGVSPSDSVVTFERQSARRGRSALTGR
ncbi:MAG: HlyD family efflux transporter periplasmic adaptor subunit [Elusimicrobia bacterium]|nr:HlyD family efflux transporter periplasmic adaptor subunit [Elusimicrobiota bacterium]